MDRPGMLTPPNPADLLLQLYIDRYGKLDGYEDAAAADCFLQLCCFGQVIYG